MALAILAPTVSNVRHRRNGGKIMGGGQVVCLGYRCSCGSYVAVYRFTRADGHWQPDQHASDRVVDCPQCEKPRAVTVADIQNLEQWDG
jgi:hypothetical protein